MLARRCFSTVKSLITEKLSVFKPSILNIVDESWMHESSKETHFKITIVSSQFENMPTVKRNYLIYKHLDSVWDHKCILLSIEGRTPSEFDSYKSNNFVFEYPSH